MTREQRYRDAYRERYGREPAELTEYREDKQQ